MVPGSFPIRSVEAHKKPDRDLVVVGGTSFMYHRAMDEVPIRRLRNHTGDVLRRVERGESVVVTRHGVPVAELRPLPRPRLSATSLLARWRGVPVVDRVAFRADVDAVLDPAL
jgi:prevent-host-death family protein